ncbi:MAG: hypothetical protein A3H97_24900 [Acidobacteria bacterium RIFCSPLOWO2_02_FULL_65_29]|nr:MAG: hypothetical protein A3H97_24900 [Acidobacteria bacterium RIFCSPLOWO2_02_FULL_65_29]
MAHVTLVFSLVAFLLTIGDYLALHDINHDYVSAAVLRSLDAAPPVLPAWTATPGEWAMVSGSLFFRAGFLLLNVMTLALCARALKRLRAAA